MRRWLLVFLFLSNLAHAQSATRLQALQPFLPELDRNFTALAGREHIPGLVWGVVLDGKLVHSQSLGYANLDTKTPVSTQTAFRIASMTKSFVALAILRLRDEGKLQLDDPVSRFLPEMAGLKLPTSDAPAITLRHLLTMTPGLPEDNPWGDRQMRMNRAELKALVARGLSFSSVPGGPFEYSNLGYIMLGQIISSVSGQPFQDYISQHILRPLGMHNTLWEYSAVPSARLALGYHWLNGKWVTEPILHDGEGAAMGGLITTLDDFARYTAFLLDAWPARDGADTGPVRRASVRELSEPRVFSGMSAKDQKVSFYAYGLRWTRTMQDVVLIGHGGGLPGYGSMYSFSPERGLAVIAFGNLRYAPVYAPVPNAAARLIEQARLPARPAAASSILLQRQQEVARLIQHWDTTLADKVVAMNFFLDRAREDWLAESRKQLARIGRVTAVSPMRPENALRGHFDLVGEKGRLEVFFTLSPEHDARLQELSITFKE